MQPIHPPQYNFLPLDASLNPLAGAGHYTPSSPEHSTTRIRIPPMAPQTRSRGRTASASGSEYHESNASMEVDEDLPHPEGDEPTEPSVEYGTSLRGRRVAKKSYKESASEDEPGLDDDPSSPLKIEHADGVDGIHDDEGGSQNGRRYALRHRSRTVAPPKGRVIVSDEDGEPAVGRYATRSRSKMTSVPDLNLNSPAAGGGRITRRSTQRSQPQASTSRPTRSRTMRRTRSSGPLQDDEDGYVDVPSSGSLDADGDFDEAPHTSPEPDEDDADADGELDVDVDADGEQEPEQDGRPYALRQRAKINYAIPPPLEEMKAPPKNRGNGGRTNGRSGGGLGGGRSKVPGWSATGAELSRWMGGGGGDDSDSDHPTRTPRKPFGVGLPGGMFAGGAAASGGGLFAGDLAAGAGTPSNLGKIVDSSLADADPLGVNQNVTFDEVGGLDDHINSLKEMTLLPLLYPEIFQRFDLTPPRGVLFHGPPGTGKTLVARALAASCRSNGKGISFFMRKGADCLSKWVGEAERQLRLLFEEARNSQPSIIFFDEIDGLAPVRSSKQDQIHASIVSTLLALMDGMDGRGQVVVIGATNRPDAVDPALRRPGRFDREFYFPLPTLEAREKILSIITKKWANWSGETGETNVKGLAKLTKGYGGADLRALCTEAALNAVQRRYPQIYQSQDRLLLQPESIGVELRDFMIAIKKLVPSSARSVSSAASALPTQLVPLLQAPLDRLKEVIDKALPSNKKRSALEEAQWEDEGDEGALERELLMQSMETLRVHRPRVILHGPPGMGQGYVAAAVLHHLEGYHVQSLDIGSLLSDSTRTPEAAIVQLFVEAKRHHPSVIYIPSLLSWSAAVSETSRTTVRAMLDTLAPTDPILLLAVVDGQFTALPRDVRAWFGPTRENRVDLPNPGLAQREEFFEGLLRDVRRPPNHFPDGVKRKKRVLEILPIAPPLEPRQPTVAELAVQEENDQRVVTLLKYRLGPILTELKRKFKRFTKRAMEEYNFNLDLPPEVEVVTTSVEVRTEQNGVIEVTTQEQRTEEVVNQQQQVNGINGIHDSAPPPPPPEPQPQLFDMDLERMHVELYKGRYLTVEDFIQDIQKIVHNAYIRSYEDAERLFRAQAMLTAAEVSINDFDPQFRLECQRMATRERKRREERRKSKGKGKAVEENGQNGVQAAPRRSARNNGLQPEMSITDPVVLERRLKRQRSNEAASTPSEDETGERGAKRSKVDTADTTPKDDRDELDLLAGSPSPHRPVGVRFAPSVERLQTPPPPAPLVNGIDHHMPPEESLPRGFPPSLLNPLPSSDVPPLVPDVDQNLFTSYEPPVAPHPAQLPPVSLLQPLQTDLQPLTDRGSTPQSFMETSAIELPTAEDAIKKLMGVEREPTPLPEFHVDEGLLFELKSSLRDNTASLTVEQLEQLRAMCLGCVWRRRSEWDRTALTRELLDVAREFLDEVSIEDMDSPI